MFPTILSLFFDFPWVSEFSTFSLSQIFNHWFPSVSASLYYFYQSPKHYNSSHWWSVQTRIVIVGCSSVFSLVYTPNSATLTLNYRLIVYTCTSMVRVSSTKLPVFRFSWPPPPPPQKKKLKFIACVFGNLFAFQSLGENGGGYISF